ncbi:AraC family transcriptional regulator [Paenibacillus psychroresistens]|uniref:AraC family transcriptional regulator n=1 Tax=Paenibacillus psychroresistens TaxID=1778678 RepID=A0A6B8RSQ1_9BACL|nr:helix-turn-helix domain-containing protein [Paenibacillus psychroresistens]QGQ98772.1 AraC family transcriptional regulator [Paenibacillus psychroresistens]
MSSKNGWKRHGFIKLLTILLAITILPVIVSSFFSYQYSINNAKRQAENYSKQLLNQTLSTHDVMFQQMQAFIFELLLNYNNYSEIIRQAPHTTKIFELYDSLGRKKLANENWLKNFYLVDTSSQKLFSSEMGSIYNFEDFTDPYLLKMFENQGNSLIINGFFKRTSSNGQENLSYIIRSSATSGHSGYIVIDIDLSKITYAKDSGNDKYGYLFVTNRKDEMLTNERADIFQKIISGNKAGKYFDIVAESKLSGLKYHYVIPKQLITENNRILLWSVLILCLAFSISGGIAAWLGSKNIYKPMGNLIRHIRQLVGEPNETAELPMDDYNYLEQIFKNLNLENKEYIHTIRTNQNLFKQKQLSCLINGDIAGFQSFEVPEKVRMPLLHENYSVIFMEIEGIHEFNKKFTSLEQELMYFAIENITEEVFGEFGFAMTCRIEPYRIVSVLNFSEGVQSVDDHESVRKIEELSRLAQAEIERLLGISTSIGFSAAVKDIHAIKTAYQQAIIANSYRVYFGKGSITYYQNVAVIDDVKLFDSKTIQWTEIKEQLKIYLRMNEWDKIEDCISQIIENISFVGITQVDLQFIFLQYIACISDISNESLIPISEVFGEDFSFDRNVSQIATMVEMQTEMIRLAQELLVKLDHKKSHIHQELIDKLLIYIEENIEKNITLESLAAKAFMHPTYLSKICKNITGIGLGEQIVRIRIQKANELLLNTNIGINDISIRVGYTNPRAFYRLFKDHTGYTPGEFRKKVSLNKIV